jgi:ubiquinone/menaquinone biosynthesis C-methylase UbiE
MNVPSRAAYDSPRLAQAYARDRPPLHERIVATIAADLEMTAPLPRALDVGCGAGLSTAALLQCAERVVGIDRSSVMVAAGRARLPAAALVVGDAEQLPFGACCFELVTAAGAINYTDRSRSLPELSRVLAHGGTIALYDFGEGRPSSGALAEWQGELDRRLPGIEGYALDPRALDYAAAGLRLAGYRELRMPIAMTAESYAAYSMSSTRVEAAIARGASERDVRQWCVGALAPLFADAALEIVFEGYIAYVRRPDHGRIAGLNPAAS